MSQQSGNHARLGGGPPGMPGLAWVRQKAEEYKQIAAEQEKVKQQLIQAAAYAEAEARQIRELAERSLVSTSLDNDDYAKQMDQDLPLRPSLQSMSISSSSTSHDNSRMTPIVNSRPPLSEHQEQQYDCDDPMDELMRGSTPHAHALGLPYAPGLKRVISAKSRKKFSAGQTIVKTHDDSRQRSTPTDIDVRGPQQSPPQQHTTQADFDIIDTFDEEHMDVDESYPRRNISKTHQKSLSRRSSATQTRPSAPEIKRVASAKSRRRKFSVAQTVPRESYSFAYQLEPWYTYFQASHVHREDHYILNVKKAHRENKARFVFGKLDRHNRGIINCEDFLFGMQTNLQCPDSERSIEKLFREIQCKSEKMLPAESQQTEQKTPYTDCISRNAFMCLMLTEREHSTWRRLCVAIETAIKAMRGRHDDEPANANRPHNSQARSTSSVRAIAPPLPRHPSDVSHGTQVISSSRSKHTSYRNRDVTLQSDMSPDTAFVHRAVNEEFMSDEEYDSPSESQQQRDVLMHDHSAPQSPHRHHTYQPQTQMATSSMSYYQGSTRGAKSNGSRSQTLSNSSVRAIARPQSQTKCGSKSERASQPKKKRRVFTAPAPADLSYAAPHNSSRSNSQAYSRRDVSSTTGTPQALSRQNTKLNSAELKGWLGQALCERIQPMKPYLAKKITGMLLNGRTEMRLWQMLSDDKVLMIEINEACAVLKDHNTKVDQMRKRLYAISRDEGFVDYTMAGYHLDELRGMTNQKLRQLENEYIEMTQ